MSRIGYLDLIGGVAGDMLLAGLVDAGADGAEILEALASLPLRHRRPRLQEVTRGGIRAMHLTGTPVTGQEPRTLGEILRILESVELPESVGDRAAAVFRRLVEAEARAHGQAANEVRLHEAGDDDAIFDVVGVLLALRSLGIVEVVSSPVPLGCGRSKTGMTWPGPATLELLKGVPVIGPPPEAEATTPTGAALVASLATLYGPTPAMILEQVGYGAGSRDSAGTPNVLRVLVGERTSQPWIVEQGLRVVEANIDDLSPQLVADAAEALFAAGALDVWVTPIQMKRGRLAVKVSVLANGRGLQAVKETFFRTTTTLGVREYVVERAVLDRDMQTVEIRGATVRIKRGRMGDSLITSMPEHVELERLARRIGVPVRQLWEEAMAASRENVSPATEKGTGSRSGADRGRDSSRPRHP